MSVHKPVFAFYLILPATLSVRPDGLSDILRASALAKAARTSTSPGAHGRSEIGINSSRALEVKRAHGTWQHSDAPIEEPYIMVGGRLQDWGCEKEHRDQMKHYVWKRDSSDHKLYSFAELCEKLPPEATIAMAGDSLSEQMAMSFLQRGAHKLGEHFFDSPSCPNGARIEFLDLREIYVHDPTACNSFTSTCLREFCRDPARFNAVSMHPQDLTHYFSRFRVAIVNEFAGVVTATALQNCHEDDAAALEFWRSQLELQTTILGETSNTSIFYRTSPAPADVFPSYMDSSRPLSLEEYNTLPRDPQAPYRHPWFDTFNKMNVQAFTRAGHGAIDLEEMLGMRVDAHPAKEHDDFLHYCMPGVPDFALDEVLDLVFSDHRTSL